MKFLPNVTWRGETFNLSKKEHIYIVPSYFSASTVLLLKPDEKTMHSFGYDAESKYTELASENKHHEWRLFRRFKMQLFGRKVKQWEKLYNFLDSFLFNLLPFYLKTCVERLEQIKRINYLQWHCLSVSFHTHTHTQQFLFRKSKQIKKPDIFKQTFFVRVEHIHVRAACDKLVELYLLCWQSSISYSLVGTNLISISSYLKYTFYYISSKHDSVFFTSHIVYILSLKET